MLKDTFGRTVNYLRLSVTDRCDFRCVYCMAEEMTFLPRAELLTLEEMVLISQCFVEMGVSKIRITGGEPLIRRNILSLFEQLGSLQGLEELTLTTNASQLQTLAQPLFDSGVRRINISLDSLKPERFKQLTRTGNLKTVLAGIEAAKKAGLKIKLNSVVLKNRNSDEILDLVNFATQNAYDISFIEEMPLGEINDHKRGEEFISSEQVRRIISREHSLIATNEQKANAGPSRYWTTADTASNIGFISPHSENFCESCNRLRLTATGKLLLCLGHENAVDLKRIAREFPGNKEEIKHAVIQGLNNKPAKHEFTHEEQPQVLRFMNTTGG